MRESTPDLIDQTLAVWQPRTSNPLTREDARQILQNVAGFLSVLLEWERTAGVVPADSSGPVSDESIEKEVIHEQE